MRAASYLESGVSADATIFAEQGYLHGYVLVSAAAASTLIVYDGPAASGKEIGRASAPANGMASVILACPVKAHTSINVAVTGAGAIAGVYYGK